MTPAQDAIVKDPLSYLLLMLAGFCGLACAITVAIVDAPGWRVYVPLATGAGFVALLVIVVLRGRRQKEGRLEPQALGFLTLGILFSVLAILGGLLAAMMALSRHLWSGCLLAFSALGAGSYAAFCFRQYHQKKLNQVPEPTSGLAPGRGSS